MSKNFKLNKTQELLYAIIKFNGGVNGKITLAKLQYFSDFIHYAFNKKPISEPEIVYTRQNYGPLAHNLTETLSELIKLGVIAESGKYNYRIKKDVDLKLTTKEKKTILYVLNKYGKVSWKDLRSISHEQVPFLSSEQGGVIEFFTAYNLIDDYPDYATFNTNLS